MHRENYSPLCHASTTSANGYSTTAQVKTKKKKKKATNFFLCFRSFDVVGSEPGRPPRNVFTYVAVGEREGGVFPKVVPVSSLATSDNEGDDEKCRSTQNEKKTRCGFYQVLKAVLFKTKLVNKIKERKSEENFANTTRESSITSTPNRHRSEDVPKVISKKNSYVGVEEKRGVVLPKVSPMASPLLGNEENDETRDSQYWRSKGRRKLSRVLKAILFETSLANKIQKRKKGSKLGRNESSKYNSEEDDPRAMSDTASSLTNCSVFISSSVNSSSSSLSQTSNSSIRSLSKRIKSLRSSSSRNFKANLKYLSGKFRPTSTSNSSRSNYAKNKSFEANTNASKEGQGQQDLDVTRIEKNKYKKGCYRSIASLGFLLMGLIFYGKICAILCTLVSLFSMPLWCTSVGQHHGSTNKIDKKKFIIGGLLPRDSNNSLQMTN
ncbi:suppressor protein SRP40-like [Pyrus ussuriensis x Pyrus communis]|uniref:Suppressor protein SRP40-like n=1 Tax=Pyrus ussuriensis x Pyrus communis TaxID=2448454 RepID=A0A5N5FP68_9ROSA|nr:suppressor protein SRP40-like [Pyrus ussuriensis x Pyrus communis]